MDLGFLNTRGVKEDAYTTARALSTVAVRTRSSRGEGSRVGFLDRRIARSVMVGLSGELGLELDMGGEERPQGLG